MKNKLKGGLSDNLTLKDISVKHKVTIDDIKSQLIKGIKIEMEHTNDKNKAKEIAMDHLTENPKYYDDLKTMEIDEITDASSSGAFDVPFNDKNKSNPLKIDGIKSVNKSRAIVDKKFPKWGGPGGIYVQIKEKCKKFPYCNQGDTNTMEILENNQLINSIASDLKIRTSSLRKIILKENMKNYNTTLDKIIKNEVKKQIISEQQVLKNEGYNILCNGKLVDWFQNEDKAKKELEEYKKLHPKQEFIIEKGKKKSFDELDEMCDDNEKEINENEMNNINPKYTHFAIDKNTNKIVNGWEYDSDMDKESIKEYCKIDIQDMGLNLKEIKVVTKKFLIKQDINPFDENNWQNIGDNTEIEETICESCKKQTCECNSSINENIKKKKNIILKESDLINLISKIINEDISEKKVKSTKEIKEVLKNNKINNTDDEDEIVSDNRGRGMQDLVYDNEPKQQFKERLKKSLNGDTKMGNSQDSPSVIKTKTGEKINKNIEKRTKLKKEEPLYKKEKIPVKN